MRRHRLFGFVMSLICVMLGSSVGYSATAVKADFDVTALGGDNHRNQLYTSALPSALCRQVELPFGRTLAQPLVIHYNQGVHIKGKDYHDIVFYLGEKHLYVLSLNGDILRTHNVQERSSVAHMTYVQPTETAQTSPAPPDPNQDWLYVATHFVTLKVFAVSDLLFSNEANPLGAFDLSDSKTPDEDESIVAAPVFLGLDSSGRDVVVMSKIPGKLAVIVGLARGNLNFSYKDIGAWNSGTAVRLGANSFVIGVGKELRKWHVAVDNGQITLVEDWKISMGSQALTRLVRERTDEGPGSRIYVAEGDGKTYWVKLTGFSRQPIPSYNGFINAGPSTDGELVYYGFRWADSQSSNKAGSSHGFVVALDRQNWTEAWRVNLDTALTGRSWGNITPAVWRSKTDPATRVLVTGDAGGALSTFSHKGEQRPFFLTEPNLVPQDCNVVESRDPGYRPSFSYGNRAILSHNARKVSGEWAWVNTQGVATEMSIYQGRLFTGYITEQEYKENAEPWESALVILRPATNIYLGALGVQRRTEAGTVPLEPDDYLRAGEQLVLTVPVSYEGDPLGEPVQVPLQVGFLSKGPVPAPVQRMVTLTPFQPATVTFDLTVPSGKEPLSVAAVVNPAIYAARQAYEAERRPPWVQEAPPQVPWAAGGAIPLGEAWAIDNARVLAFTRQPRDDAYAALLDVPAKSGSTVPIKVMVGYLNDMGLAEADVAVSLVIRRVDGSEEYVLGPVTRTIRNKERRGEAETLYDLSPGLWEVTLQVDYPPDTSPKNNRLVKTVQVLAVPEFGSQEKGSRLTD